MTPQSKKVPVCAEIQAHEEQKQIQIRLDHIRQQMYTYGVSRLNVSPQQAAEVAEIAVRVAAGRK